MSGLPIDPACAKLFDSEFKEGYDAAMLKHAKSKNADGTINFNAVDMLGVQSDLAELETALKAKYSVEGTAELPKSAKGWHKLVTELEAPLLIAKSSENPNELIIVLVDTPIG